MLSDETLWLTGLEYDVMICAEAVCDILPFLVEHRGPAGRRPSFGEAATLVSAYVGRGWLEVHRLENWTDEGGRPGLRYGDPIDHAELPDLLADPTTWAEPVNGDWTGALTVAFTAAWTEHVAGRRVQVLPTWTR